MSDGEREVYLAQKEIAARKAVLQQRETEVNQKSAALNRANDERAKAQKRVDIKVTGFPGWRDAQKKLQKQLDARNREFSAAQGELKNAVSLRDNQAAAVRDAEQTLQDAKKRLEQSKVQDAIFAAVAFYEDITKKYSKDFADIAKTLAENSKSGRINGVEHALQVFEKHAAILNKKYSTAERNAIASAVESLKYDEWSKQLNRYAKVIRYTGWGEFALNWTPLVADAVRSGNYRPLLIAVEKEAATRGVKWLLIGAMTLISLTPPGLWARAIITVVAGVLCSFISEKDIERLNRALGL